MKACVEECINFEVCGSGTHRCVNAIIHALFGFNGLGVVCLQYRISQDLVVTVWSVQECVQLSGRWSLNVQSKQVLILAHCRLFYAYIHELNVLSVAFSVVSWKVPKVIPCHVSVFVCILCSLQLWSLWLMLPKLWWTIMIHCSTGNFDTHYEVAYRLSVGIKISDLVW